MLASLCVAEWNQRLGTLPSACSTPGGQAVLAVSWQHMHKTRSRCSIAKVGGGRVAAVTSLELVCVSTTIQS